MKGFKQGLCMALCLGMALSCLAGCSGKNPSLDLSDEVYETSEWEITGGDAEGGTYTSVTGGTGDNGSGSDKTSTDGTNSDSPWEKSDEAIDRDIGDPFSVDLQGKTMVIYGMEEPDQSASKAEKAKYDLFSKIQKEMNCKISFVESTFEKTKEKLILNSMSNTYFADIVSMQQYGVLNVVTSKLLHDMGKVTTVSLAEPYMNAAGGVDAFHLGSGFWAVNDPLGVNGIVPCLVFNKRIMKEVTSDSGIASKADENYPYTLMEQNKWTVSELRKLNKAATKELNGDGKMDENDQWGMIQVDIGTAGFGTLLESMGVDMLLNEKGTLKYNMEDPKVIDAINLGADLFYNDKAVISLMDEDGKKSFMSGHSLFYSGYLGVVTEIADMKDDFGVVPFPRGDSEKSYSTAVNWNLQSLMLPGSLDSSRLKLAGALLQAYCLGAQDVVKQEHNEWGVRYLRDEESKDNLWTIYSSADTPAANAASAGTEIQEGTWRVCYDIASKSAVSTIQANKSAAIKAIDDINKKLK